MPSDVSEQDGRENPVVPKLTYHLHIFSCSFVLLLILFNFIMMGITKEELELIFDKKLEAIRDSMKFINDQYESMVDKLGQIEQENKALKLENHALISQLQTVTTTVKQCYSRDSYFIT